MDVRKRRDELEERIAYLEKRMEQVLTEGVALRADITGTGRKAPEKQVKKEKKPVAAASEDVLTLIAEWDAFRKSMPDQQALILDSAVVEPGGGNLVTIALTDNFGYSYYTRSESHKQDLEKALSAYIGKEITVSFRLQERQETETDPGDDIRQMMNLDGVIYEEED